MTFGTFRFGLKLSVEHVVQCDMINPKG